MVVCKDDRLDELIDRWKYILKDKVWFIVETKIDYKVIKIYW